MKPLYKSTSQLSVPLILVTPGVSVGGGGGFGVVSCFGGAGVVSCVPLPGPTGSDDPGLPFEQAKKRPANVQIIKSVRFIY